MFEDPFFGGCPEEMVKKFIGREMLFKVENTSGLVFNGDQCYEVTETCSNTEVMCAFHSADSTVTPRKVSMVYFNLYSFHLYIYDLLV